MRIDYILQLFYSSVFFLSNVFSYWKSWQYLQYTRNLIACQKSKFILKIYNRLSSINDFRDYHILAPKSRLYYIIFFLISLSKVFAFHKYKECDGRYSNRAQILESNLLKPALYKIIIFLFFHLTFLSEISMLLEYKKKYGS